MRLQTDDRGVSRLLSYMLTVGVAMLLITGLLFAGSQLVENQRERSMRSQMTVVGHQVAGSLENADRLVSTTGDAPHDIANSRIHRLAIYRSLPQRIVESNYQVHVTDEMVYVNTSDGQLSVTVPYRTATDVRESTAHGGEIVIEYATGSNELVVRDD